MSFWYLMFSVVILLTVVGGLIRVFNSPKRADRMLAAQLCGTASVAIIIMFARILNDDFLFELGLVIAILAAISTIAFVRLTWQRNMVEEE